MSSHADHLRLLRICLFIRRLNRGLPAKPCFSTATDFLNHSSGGPNRPDHHQAGALILEANRRVPDWKRRRPIEWSRL